MENIKCGKYRSGNWGWNEYESLGSHSHVPEFCELPGLFAVRISLYICVQILKLKIAPSVVRVQTLKGSHELFTQTYIFNNTCKTVNLRNIFVKLFLMAGQCPPTRAGGLGCGSRDGSNTRDFSSAEHITSNPGIFGIRFLKTIG